MKLCPIYHLCRVVSQGRAKERVWVNNWYIGDGCLNNFLFHFMKKIVKEKKKKKNCGNESAPGVSIDPLHAIIGID